MSTTGRLLVLTATISTALSATATAQATEGPSPARVWVHPGVYVEEVEVRVPAVGAVSTSTPAFGVRTRLHGGLDAGRTVVLDGVGARFGGAYHVWGKTHVLPKMPGVRQHGDIELARGRVSGGCSTDGFVGAPTRRACRIETDRAAEEHLGDHTDGVAPHLLDGERHGKEDCEG